MPTTSRHIPIQKIMCRHDVGMLVYSTLRLSFYVPTQYNQLSGCRDVLANLLHR